ncbi:lipase family protein [Flavobacterium selenitireducens]|uniref:alpha/beta hydrolase n=1 Tax=Flavobacterium selenitireducens TaxID=2722704 RepID=UPI00168ADBC5|nr:alpha/beta hydrolase [Flavobacterium selenitireducens]MBD3582799.1 alpha/beta hydrolase [Flavobacterium selenitireducens]
MRKIPVYFMPGLAASPEIFERIQLPEDQFETHFLEWSLPEPGESLTEYARRMCIHVTDEDAVLIGVSFGGVLVQEMAQFAKPSKVIIISSVKSNLQFPLRMRLTKYTKLYKIFPTHLASDFGRFEKLPFGSKFRQRLKLYEKFLAMRDKIYLDWALEQIILWKRSVADQNVIHIHGDSDEVFPAKYITTDYIPVKGGTHIMILNKYKWLNENLPKIILGEPIQQ